MRESQHWLAIKPQAGFYSLLYPLSLGSAPSTLFTLSGCVPSPSACHELPCVRLNLSLQLLCSLPPSASSIALGSVPPCPSALHRLTLNETSKPMDEANWPMEEPQKPMDKTLDEASKPLDDASMDEGSRPMDEASRPMEEPRKPMDATLDEASRLLDDASMDEGSRPMDEATKPMEGEEKTLEETMEDKPMEEEQKPTDEAQRAMEETLNEDELYIAKDNKEDVENDDYSDKVDVEDNNNDNNTTETQYGPLLPIDTVVLLENFSEGFYFVRCCCFCHSTLPGAALEAISVFVDFMRASRLSHERRRLGEGEATHL
ncbi:hypothetical protein L7F22_061262 [Adiantum nelumboides]|nr:hypothetical protein [Adiantum nelumboides]